MKPVLSTGGLSRESRNEAVYSARTILDLAGIALELRVSDEPGIALTINNNVLADARTLMDVFSISTLRRESDTGRFRSDGRFDERGITWDTLSAPVTAEARRIRTMIETIDPGYVWPESMESKHMRVIFTHDIDRVDFRDIFSLIKIPLQYICPRRTWLPWKRAMNPNMLFSVFKQVLELEFTYAIRSWCFFMGSGKGFGLRQARYNPEDRSVRRWLNSAGSMGTTIGLHGSYLAAETSRYGIEKKRLERVLSKNVSTHRNHYLRLNYTDYWHQLAHAGFRLDSTVGYADRIGFRAGIASLYRPFDPISGGQSAISVLPLVYMDRSYHLDDPDRIIAEIDAVFECVAQAKGQVAVLTHPESFALDDRWFDLYAAIIRTALDKGACVDGTLPSMRENEWIIH
ncbi:hypothetical protein JXA80_03515 [bacterium]|nr:hypothetical protein [candidate division CSSED10-310 bacterium]